MSFMNFSLMKEFKELMNNKIAIVMAIVTTLWCLTDITSRLFLKEGGEQKVITSLPISALQLPQLPSSVYQNLKSTYQQYNQKKDVVEKNNGMSLSEQNKQSGLLESVFVDGYKLSLKSVIKTNEDISALISIEDLNTGNLVIEKFIDNSQVHGYQLSIEKNTQVMLTKQLEKNLQKIILTMYKSTNNDKKKSL